MKLNKENAVSIAFQVTVFVLFFVPSIYVARNDDGALSNVLALWGIAILTGSVYFFTLVRELRGTTTKETVDKAKNVPFDDPDLKADQIVDVAKPDGPRTPEPSDVQQSSEVSTPTQDPGKAAPTTPASLENVKLTPMDKINNPDDDIEANFESSYLMQQKQDHMSFSYRKALAQEPRKGTVLYSRFKDLQDNVVDLVKSFQEGNKVDVRHVESQVKNVCDAFSRLMDKA